MRNRASTVRRIRWLTLAVGVFFMLTVPRARGQVNNNAFEVFAGPVTLVPGETARLHVTVHAPTSLELGFWTPTLDEIASTGDIHLDQGQMVTLDVSAAAAGPFLRPIMGRVGVGRTVPGGCNPTVILQVFHGPPDSLVTSALIEGRIRAVPPNPREEAARDALRTLRQAEMLFFEGSKAKKILPSYGSISDLQASGLWPNDNPVTGYDFEVVLDPLRFRGRATPSPSGTSTDRAFFVDELNWSVQTGVIRFVLGFEAGVCQSPVDG